MTWLIGLLSRKGQSTRGQTAACDMTIQNPLLGRPSPVRIRGGSLLKSKPLRPM